jgi:hypothetical protein
MRHPAIGPAQATSEALCSISITAMEKARINKEIYKAAAMSFLPEAIAAIICLFSIPLLLHKSSFPSIGWYITLSRIKNVLFLKYAVVIGKGCQALAVGMVLATWYCWRSSDDSNWHACAEIYENPVFIMQHVATLIVLFVDVLACG